MTVAKVLNIEVGDLVTKVCVSEKTKKNYQIRNSFLMQTPVGAVRDGQIIQIDVMAAALRNALQENGAGGVKNVTFTLSSTKVASREVMLPPVKDARIKSVVETNASDYFPVDMSGYCIAHTLLERVGGSTPGCRVQVTAAPRPLMEGYAAMAEAAGLMLEAIDYCGNSQYQVLKTLPSEDVVMYVDVNVSNTLVTFMQSGVMMMQRNINFGGDELISTLLEVAGKENSEFLTVLRKADNAEYLASYLSKEQQEEALNRLVGGISRSADFFKSNRSAIEIGKVVLMGVCGSIAGLADMVQNAVGTTAVSLQDVKGIDSVANSIGGINSYISCIGSLVNSLELLPEDLTGAAARKKKSKNKRNNDSIALGVVLLIVLSLAGAGLAGFAFWQYSQAKAEQEKLEKRIEELAHVSTTAELYEKYQTTQAVLDQIRAYNDTHNAYLVDFLEELERKMPTSLLVMSAICDEQGVIMNMVTPGMEEANVIIKQLRGFETIKHLEISTITESMDEAGLSSATFAIRCAYNAPETAGAATAE